MMKEIKNATPVGDRNKYFIISDDLVEGDVFITDGSVQYYMMDERTAVALIKDVVSYMPKQVLVLYNLWESNESF